jgi:hypothetical protein
LLWIACHPGAGRDPVLALNLMGTRLDTSHHRDEIPLNEIPNGIAVNLLFGQPSKRAKKSRNDCFLQENSYCRMLIEK